MTKLRRILDWVFHKNIHENRMLTLLHWLGRKGFGVFPFYLTLEGDSKITYKKLPGYSTVLLKVKDMKELEKIPGRYVSSEQLSAQFREGIRCLGIKHNKKIVAFTWYNLKKCTARTFPFDLKENEAYLTDAYTIEDYRGKGIAPYLRNELYKILRKSGRHVFYSITEYFNYSSINFKKKLGAKNILLGLHFEFFKKIRFTIKLRKYNTNKKRFVHSEEV